MIASKEQLEQAAVSYGLLPFFSNPVPGFSVQEMAAPGVLFGDDRDDYGCWGWKGPVIREKTTAYGKFFRRKAGFVSVELLPDFLNYRRSAYPVKPYSTESMLLDIICERGVIASTDLRHLVFGVPGRRRNPDEPVDMVDSVRVKRHSLEGPLQRLQMGGHLLIADFRYKKTSCGDMYGWGVAVYSTPGSWFGHKFGATERTPEESFRLLVDHVAALFPRASRAAIEAFLK